MKRTTFASISFIALLLGLGFARTGFGLHYSWLILAIIVTGILFVFSRNSTKRSLPLIGIFVCCFLLGWLRGSDYFQKLSVYDDLSGKQVVVEVTALQDAVYDDK